MARQQERARRTRAAIIRSAAVEFGKSGYAAASLNRILEGSRATKGAMYFHFDSKEDLARAVLEAAVDRYRASTERWLARGDLGPLDTLHGMIDEIALRLENGHHHPGGVPAHHRTGVLSRHPGRRRPHPRAVHPAARGPRDRTQTAAPGRRSGPVHPHPGGGPRGPALYLRCAGRSGGSALPFRRSARGGHRRHRDAGVDRGVPARGLEGVRSVGRSQFGSLTSGFGITADAVISYLRSQRMPLSNGPEQSGRAPFV